MTPDKLKVAKKLLEGEVPPKEVAKTLEISIATLYRWIPASGKNLYQNKIHFICTNNQVFKCFTTTFSVFCLTETYYF